MAVIGWVCIIIGVLFLVVGLVGAAKELWQDQPDTGPESIPSWLGTLLEILNKGGWTASAALGIVLLLIGLGLTAPAIFGDDSGEDTPAAAATLVV